MHTSTTFKKLQTASVSFLFLLCLALSAQPVWAQSGEDDPPPPPDGYNFTTPVNSSPETSEDKPPPPPDGGYNRWSQSTPGALTAGTLAEQPTKLALLGNYPNPFNPETTIRFAVQEGQHVRLTVFNLLGQAVQVLVDGYTEAGQHEARFMAQDLPSGTYFTRLETRTGVAIQKMVLAK